MSQYRLRSNISYDLPCCSGHFSKKEFETLLLMDHLHHNLDSKANAIYPDVILQVAYFPTHGTGASVIEIFRFCRRDATERPFTMGI